MVSLLEHYVPVNGIILLPHGLFFIYIHRSYTLFWWEEKPFTVGCTAWFFLFIETLASMFLLTC